MVVDTIDTGTESGLVTPEAVALDLPVANVGSRALASLIDVVAMFLAFLGVVFLSTFLFIADTTSATVIVFVGVFAILFVYPVAFETFSRGRSLGKLAMGLRVVTVEGGPVGFRHAAIRAALWPVEVLAMSGGIAVLTALFTARAQRVGDLVAGTIVIQARAVGDPLQAHRFTPPRGLEEFARRLDASALTEADYEVIRNLLVRRGELPPAEHARLAREVAGRLRPRLSPHPPAGTDPVAELTAVAAAYQQRFTARSDLDVTDWVWR